MHIMKKLFKISKIKLLIGLVFLGTSHLSLAQTPLAVVQKVSGGAFMTTSKGRTIPVQKGQHIYDLAEINTTLGAEVSFNDYYDHQYHLSGAGNIKFMNKVIELRRGYLWFQALGQNNHGFYLQTANAQMGLAPGEGVLSFDPAKDKSQLLSLKGGFVFGNLLDTQLNVRVRSGQFSFVDLDYQEGVPRSPTPVGQESFGKIVGLFQKVQPLDGTREASRYEFVAQKSAQENKSRSSNRVSSRRPASVESQKGEAQSKASGIRFLPLEYKSELERQRRSLLRAYDKEQKKRKKPQRSPAETKVKKLGVPLNVYGAPESHKSQGQERAPASVRPSREVEKIIDQARKPASVSPQKQLDGFERVLQKEYREQKRHPEEVNQLIDELESFNQDFEQGY